MQGHMNVKKYVVYNVMFLRSGSEITEEMDLVPAV